jgi:preprotein translocase subunit SecY
MRALELAPYAVASQGFLLQTSLALIAGSFMIHHCANTITAAGVGNGSTLVICMGIIAGRKGGGLVCMWVGDFQVLGPT